jgi:hypothetical protein
MVDLPPQQAPPPAPPATAPAAAAAIAAEQATAGAGAGDRRSRSRRRAQEGGGADCPSAAGGGSRDHHHRHRALCREAADCDRHPCSPPPLGGGGGGSLLPLPHVRVAESAAAFVVSDSGRGGRYGQRYAARALWSSPTACCLGIVRRRTATEHLAASKIQALHRGACVS